MKSIVLLNSFLLILGLSFYSLQGLSQSSGIASYYANKFDGRKTANGEIFRQDSLTAAHKTLPLGTFVRVVNLKNDSSVIVKINDRLPKSSKRTIDLSRKAAEQLDFIRAGLTEVNIAEVKKVSHQWVEKNDYLFYRDQLSTLSCGIVDTITILSEREKLIHFDTTLINQNIAEYYRNLSWNYYMHYVHIQNVESAYTSLILQEAINYGYKCVGLREKENEMHDLTLMLFQSSQCAKGREAFDKFKRAFPQSETIDDLDKIMERCTPQN